MIPFSASFEKNLFDQEEEAKNAGVAPPPPSAPSQLQKIIRTGYSTIDLIYFFTAGHDEVRCWTIREGTKAPQAAGVIHTDFEHGFICVEVMKYEDFVRCGSEAAVKLEGKYRQLGKEYVVEDGDICFFKFNAPFKGKK